MTVPVSSRLASLSQRPGGGGTPLYKLHRYVPPHRVGFLRRFGLKTGIHFAQFGLESFMVFDGTTGVYEGIYRFNSKLARKKEKYDFFFMRIRNEFEAFFLFAL